MGELVCFLSDQNCSSGCGSFFFCIALKLWSYHVFNLNLHEFMKNLRNIIALFTYSLLKGNHYVVKTPYKAINMRRYFNLFCMYTSILTCIQLCTFHFPIVQVRLIFSTAINVEKSTLLFLGYNEFCFINDLSLTLSRLICRCNICIFLLEISSIRVYTERSDFYQLKSYCLIRNKK